MKKRILFVCALASCFTVFNAQRWESVSQKTSQIREGVEVQHSYRVDLKSLREMLRNAEETGKGATPVIISLPTVDGKIEKFAVYSNPVLDKSLADKYQLGSYTGVGVDDPSKYLRFSTSPNDMQSMIIKNGIFQFIEPISADKQTYGVFYKTKNEGEHGFKCDTGERDFKDINKLVENGKKMLSGVGIASRPTNTKYRDFRMALSVTGEYSQYQLTAAGTPANATDDVKKGVVLAAMNNTMTRINGVFERDFGAHLTVQNLPDIIYLDPATDPYSNNLNLQLQQTLTSVVGNANYDIGHVLNQNAERSGNAGGIGIVCVDPATNTEIKKGSAYTQGPVPVGEVFDFTAAHEMGHQLGANHTFSNTSVTDANQGANVEPGGGTTIMGYAGITYDNVQANADGYFHYKSIDQVLTNLENKLNCGASQNINNNTAPAINPLVAYSIPKGTAYYLEALAIDAENDPVNYTWEQNDSTDEFSTISGDSGWGYNPKGALSRSVPGTANGRRYFPKLASVMNGILTDKQAWETVSYIPRTLNYAVTVRDQNAQRPMVSSSTTTVTVGNDGPFKFNGLTASSVLYNDAVNTIYWDVANTNAAPYNTASVKIDYTTDNGTTWTNLVAATPNTGSYSAQMPGNINGAIKLRVSAVGNIFYAVSPAITVGAAPTSSTSAPTGISTIDTEIFKTTARVSWNSVPGATYSVNYRKAGTANWSNAVSQANSVVLNNLEDETNYEVQVAAVVNSVSGAFSNNYTFKTKGLKTGVDYCLLNSGSPYVGSILKVTVANLDYSDLTARSYKDLSEDLTKVVNLTQGSTYTLTPRIGNLLQNGIPVNLSAWIDYNRNGVFEATERVGQTSATTNAGNIGLPSFNFTVPATSYSGDKVLRMRVVGKFSTSALNSVCGELASQAGGIMDLPVKITASTLAVRETVDTKSSEVSIYPNPADTFVEVKNLKGKGDYKIYSADGRLVQEGKIDGKINVASLVKGMYVITIKDEKNTYNNKLIKK
ncbi:reprolysin-like metallopeptidase [Chryseobacterium cucumeris]|uniref:T9SS C-terminal target domain-containing protein n=1 Tax=Chryseobacterium cucumeris TaxID=1813611 RepID=A0ABX9XD43_9FLAO|nr:zinc-dependent metalloprotease family protein [Chryseobacterium cucumeris]MDH5033925.1 zinc-dependent metalloprotease family protein [Chryseobacterium cucumeris]ROH94737.1 T9SS C-terminal target domain-containing protein [Chryseobacterium cucumeris]